MFGDAARLPFADGSFDVVVCLEVIEHLPQPEQVLREVNRVLRAGGRAYFSMPFLYPIHDAPHDFTRWTENGWRRRARDAGFSIQRLHKRTHAVRAAGLLACLALTGPIARMGRAAAVLYLPLAAVLVFVINSLAYLASLIIPDWPGMATGYDLVLGKD